FFVLYSHISTQVFPPMQPTPAPAQPAALARKRLYDSRAFARMYHTDAPLGALWTPQATTFALWAPTAQAVALSLYRSGTGGDALCTLPLARGERGVWRAAAEGNLDGVY